MSKKLLFQNLTKNMMENLSTGKNIGKQECTAENEVQQELWQGVENQSVVQKMKYNKNCDRVWKTRV